jgi:nicotinamidase-related amidase
MFPMSELGLDPKTTAIVVIDMQKGIVGMPGNPHSSEVVLENVVRLLDAGRKAGALAVLVHVGISADWGDAVKTPIDEPMPFSGKRPADWSELLPELKQQAGDIEILKRQWGAFYGTELELQLRRRGRTTIVLCGIATEYGVETTARDGWEHGYAMVFAEDAMTGRGGHEHTVKTIFPRLGRVRSTAEIVAEFAGGNGA